MLTLTDGNGDKTSWNYDFYGRVTNKLDNLNNVLFVYKYDADNRLTNRWSAAKANTAYGYDAVGNLTGVTHLVSPSISLSYDVLNRLTTMVDGVGTTVYGYDAVGQVLSEDGPWVNDTVSYTYQNRLRTSLGIQAPNGAAWTKGYTYDNLGELVTSYGYEPAGGSRVDEYRVYAYDGAGNLAQKNTSVGPNGQTLYRVNSLNELTNTGLGFNAGGWSAILPVSGSTTMPVTNLTVNGAGVVPYQDQTFAASEQVTSGGVKSYTALGRDVYGRSSSSTISVTVVPTNSAYSYDLNGNLLSDGTRNFGYDDENELISVWQPNAWSNSFAYDGKMRRRIERDYLWAGSGWLETNEIHFVYDGNLVVQERNGSNLPQVTYTRGTDLSGSLQGAGGIGGLLARTDNTRLAVGDSLASAYYHCDGNGNVTCLITPYQQIAAKYLYDPYGNMLAMYGSLAGANVYRFSSKEWNGNSGLYYYLYRFYDPNLQRWLNRDPKKGFPIGDLYEYVNNDCIDYIDAFGKQPIVFPIPPIFPPAPPPAPSCPSAAVPCQVIAQDGQGKTPDERADNPNWVMQCKLCVDYLCGLPSAGGIANCAHSGYDACDEGKYPSLWNNFKPPKTGPGKPMPR